MRDMGVRGEAVYCQDYTGSHSQAIKADQSPDDLPLPDIEQHFVCKPAASAPRMCDRISFGQNSSRRDCWRGRVGRAIRYWQPGRNSRLVQVI